MSHSSEQKPAPDALLVPVSYGEVADKISILRIKVARVTDPEKLRHVAAELGVLEAAYSEVLRGRDKLIIELSVRLDEVNLQLWDIEDAIRECERNKNFGADFIALARAVYFTNDERARLKREINVVLGSPLVEEKSYAPYS